MELTLNPTNHPHTITAYTPGEITINQTVYKSPLILNEQVLLPWKVSSIQNLTTENLTKLIEYKPRIILLGVGETYQILPPHLLTDIYRANIGIEIMDTRAACRTFNLLLADNREVLAALFI